MGANLPKNPRDAVAWIAARAGDWEQHAAELGLDPQAAAQMVALAQAAQAAHQHAYTKRSEALYATKAWRTKAGEAMDAAAVLISAIKTTAQGEDQKERTRLYGLARLCLPRSRRRRAPRPGRVAALRTRLLESGSLELRIEAEHPKGVRGVIYEIWRQDSRADHPDEPGVSGQFVFIANARSKRYADRTIPAGTAMATYRVAATTVSGRGPDAFFTVRFGREPVRARGASARAASARAA